MDFELEKQKADLICQVEFNKASLKKTNRMIEITKEDINEFIDKLDLARSNNGFDIIELSTIVDGLNSQVDNLISLERLKKKLETEYANFGIEAKEE